jgi:hypothetical protein
VRLVEQLDGDFIEGAELPVLVERVQHSWLEPAQVDVLCDRTQLKVERRHAYGAARDEGAARCLSITVEPDPFEAEVSHQQDNRELSFRHEPPCDDDVAAAPNEGVKLSKETWLAAAEETRECRRTLEVQVLEGVLVSEVISDCRFASARNACDQDAPHAKRVPVKPDDGRENCMAMQPGFSVSILRCRPLPGARSRADSKRGGSAAIRHREPP